jgi:peptidyl-prolyl cis-trans isomerase B (cyclophilin B)
MSRKRTRNKQLQKQASRRAAERRRKRRQRVIAGVVAGALALGAVGYAGWVFLFAGEEEERAGPAAGPTSSPSPREPEELPVACGAEVPRQAGKEKQMFDAPPEMVIDRKKAYRATLDTSCGPIELELFADQTPVTVNNFVFLAREGFYDGLTFHRVIPDFVLQGGDPAGDGSGGPGYQFEDEIVKRLKFNQPGLLAMANSGPDTNGSQFFITTGEPTHLNGLHTIFGRVTGGMNAVREIEALGSPEGTPTARIYIERVTIEER